MKRKFKKIRAGRGGWSPWQQPVMKGYLMKCCDCGLVHEIDFRVIFRARRAK